MRERNKGSFPEWDTCSDCRYTPAFCGRNVRNCRGLEKEKNRTSEKSATEKNPGLAAVWEDLAGGRS